MGVGSASFIGVGMLAAILPMMSVERGSQMVFVLQSCLLLVSGVYYPTTILPGWMQLVSRVSPATYVLDAVRKALIDGASASQLLPSVKSILSKRGSVVSDTTTNSLIVTETRSRISEVSDFIKNLDIRTPQVSIQAKIIFVDRTHIEDLGLKYDFGAVKSGEIPEARIDQSCARILALKARLRA